LSQQNSKTKERRDHRSTNERGKRTSYAEKPRDAKINNDGKQIKAKAFDREGRHDYVGSAHNDPKWYLANGQLASDVASFSFNNAVGNPTTLSANGAGNNYVFNVPGIGVIYTMPTVGVSGGLLDETAPVNVATRMVYSDVRHANSGSTNYDAPDLMMYLLAMDSVYTFWAWMVRLYGILGTFSKKNRYIGDALVSAAGGRATSLRSNYAQFRAYINQFAIKASQWAVPDIFSLFTRHAWMYSNVYLDEDVTKAQMYMYDPAFVYRYEIDQSTGAGGLVPYPVTCEFDTTAGVIKRGTAKVLSEIQTIGDSLISALSTMQDISIMSGDIIKAYGEGALYKLGSIDDNYAVGPVFSEEVLMQIHNTKFVGDQPVQGDDQGSWNPSLVPLCLTQTTGVGGGQLVFRPAFKHIRNLCYNTLLDIWKENVTPEDSLVATRNMVAAEMFDSANDVGFISACGSELPFFMKIFKYTTSGLQVIDGIGGGDNDSIPNANDLVTFNEYPISLNVTTAGVPKWVFGEVSNYTVLTPNDIAALHGCALLSMFGIRL